MSCYTGLEDSQELRLVHERWSLIVSGGRGADEGRYH